MPPSTENRDADNDAAVLSPASVGSSGGSGGDRDRLLRRTHPPVPPLMALNLPTSGEALPDAGKDSAKLLLFPAVRLPKDGLRLMVSDGFEVRSVNDLRFLFSAASTCSCGRCYGWLEGNGGEYELCLSMKAAMYGILETQYSSIERKALWGMKAHMTKYIFHALACLR